MISLPGDQTAAIKKLNTTKAASEVTDAEWKSVLSPEEYEVTRKAGSLRRLLTFLSISGTEPQGGHFDKYFEKGRYVCTCCQAELFK